MGIFKKLNLSKNLKTLKKSDKDVHCVNCGARTGLITRVWLLDDKCLCLNCQNAIPTYYRKHYGTLTSEEYSKIFDYTYGESKELAKQFEKKHTFLNLQLDAVNGVLRYKKSNMAPLYVKLENIADFSLSYYEHLIQNGPSIITMTLESFNPSFTIQEELEVPGTKYDCDQFMNYYYSIREMREGERYTHSDQSDTNAGYSNSVNSADDVQLQKALAMFMFDNINEVTAETLKSQRNRLIKSFHPDANSGEDTKYAQKINEAYELLHKYVK